MIKKIKLLILSLVDNDTLEEAFVKRYKEDIESEEQYSESDQRKIFDDLSRVEGYSEFLRWVLKRDRIRYFNAPKDGQDVVRGAFMRTLWQLKSLKRPKKKTEKSFGFTSPRHG